MVLTEMWQQTMHTNNLFGAGWEGGCVCVRLWCGQITKLEEESVKEAFEKSELQEEYKQIAEVCKSTATKYKANLGNQKNTILTQKLDALKLVSKGKAGGESSREDEERAIERKLELPKTLRRDSLWLRDGTLQLEFVVDNEALAGLANIETVVNNPLRR